MAGNDTDPPGPLHVVPGWRRFGGNPVIPHVAGDNRGPHVVWSGPTRRWVVVFYNAVVYAVRSHGLTALGTAPLTVPDGGRVSLSGCFLPKTTALSVVARGGTARVRSIVVTELRSAWLPTGVAATAATRAR